MDNQEIFALMEKVDKLITKVTRFEKVINYSFISLVVLGVLFGTYRLGYKYGFAAAVNLATEYIKNMQTAPSEPLLKDSFNNDLNKSI